MKENNTVNEHQSTQCWWIWYSANKSRTAAANKVTRDMNFAMPHDRKWITCSSYDEQFLSLVEILKGTKKKNIYLRSSPRIRSVRVYEPKILFSETISGALYSEKAIKETPIYSWRSCISLRWIWAAWASRFTWHCYSLLTEPHNSGPSATRLLFLQAP
jgi:hypothetical protein